MNLDETRGWKSNGRAGGSFKTINGCRYQIFERVCGAALWVTRNGCSNLIKSYPSKDAAKRAAHEHAEATP